MSGRDGNPYRLTPLKGDRGGVYRNANEDAIEALYLEGHIKGDEWYCLSTLKCHWINASRDKSNELTDYVDTPVGVGLPSEVVDSLDLIVIVTKKLKTFENHVVWNLVRENLCPTNTQMSVLRNACITLNDLFGNLALDTDS